MKVELEYFLKNKELWKLLKDKIVIYPTDTVYGIGCNAFREDLVEKIYEIKQRPKDKPVSVIIPKGWIEKYFHTDGIEDYLNLLPGPYTILLKKKEKFLDHISKDYLGIRVIDYPFQNVIENLQIPFVTTSANISGNPSKKSVDEIEKELIDKVDLIIDGGILKGTPSDIVDPYKGEIKKRNA